MRSFLTLFLASVALLTGAQASSITLTNFSGATTNLVADWNGNLIPTGTGFAAIGTFTVSDAVIQSSGFNPGQWNIMTADFQQFADSVSMGFNDFAGIYQSVVTDAIATGSAFDGKDVYTVLGSGTSILNSGQLLVYKHDHGFAADPAPTANAVLGSGQGGSLLLGDFGKYRATYGPINNVPAYSLQVRIPEPGTASFLFVATGFLLLRRRR